MKTLRFFSLSILIFTFIAQAQTKKIKRAQIDNSWDKVTESYNPKRKIANTIKSEDNKNQEAQSDEILSFPSARGPADSGEKDAGPAPASDNSDGLGPQRWHYEEAEAEDTQE